MQLLNLVILWVNSISFLLRIDLTFILGTQIDSILRQKPLRTANINYFLIIIARPTFLPLITNILRTRNSQQLIINQVISIAHLRIAGEIVNTFVSRPMVLVLNMRGQLR